MNLPILAVSEFAFSPRLTLKITSSWREESAWCRLLKIAYWNGLNAAELAYLFGPTICLPASMIEQPRAALRRALAHFLAGGTVGLAQAFPPTLFDRLTGGTSSVLRGCPDCFRFGFHSALFQSLAIARCPFHGAELVTGCPSCGYAEDYAIPRTLRRSGHRCSNCGRAILRMASGVNTVAAVPDLSLELQNWRHWLEWLLAGWRTVRKQKTGIQAARLLDICQRWSRHYIKAPPLYSAGYADRPRTGSLAESVEDEAQLHRSAMALYFQERRNLYKALRLRQPETVTMPSWTVGASVMLPLQEATYVLWRASWERHLIHPADDWQSRHAIAPGVECWIASRPLEMANEITTLNCFEQELQRSYTRCRHLAEWMLQHGGLLLAPEVFSIVAPRHCVRAA